MPTGQHCNQPTPCDIAPPPPCGIAATAAMPIRCRLNVSSFFLLQRRRPVDCFLILLRDERLPTKTEWQHWLCGMWNLLHHHAPQQHCHHHQQRRLNVSFFLSMWRQKATTTQKPPNTAIVLLATPPLASHQHHAWHQKHNHHTLPGTKATG